jgi:hypothetical protein
LIRFSKFKEHPMSKSTPKPSALPAPLAPPKIWHDRSRQATDYEGIFAVPGAPVSGATGPRPDWRVRVHIHAESYDFQSYGRAETFDSVAGHWNVAAVIPGLLLKVTWQAGRDDPQAFDADIRTLLDEVRLLFGD